MSDPNLPPDEKEPESTESSAKESPIGVPQEERHQEMPEEPTCGVAHFPMGFWKRVDYLLHHKEEVTESLRQDSGLRQLSSIFFVVSMVMAGLYGAVMGATNLLQGSEMLLRHKLLMILVTAVKVPVLYLLTLGIILLPIYVSNAFVGARLQFRQMLALLLTSVAIMATLLASMATVAFFFALTSRTYDFIKLLHVLFFAYAGLVGLGYLARGLKAISAPLQRSSSERGTVRHTPQWLFIGWLLLYMFVGTQLAWVLRPFVGSPTEKFQVFRPRYGNFYESVFHSWDRLMQTKIK
jgi:hypothetical protein